MTDSGKVRRRCRLITASVRRWRERARRHFERMGCKGGLMNTTYADRYPVDIVTTTTRHDGEILVFARYYRSNDND